MARTSNLLNLATVARTGVAYYPGGWNFQNGGTFGEVVEFAANTPRIAQGRLLVEEGTTNQIPNPHFVGATGSTGPTGWSIANTDALTLTYTRVTVQGSPALRVDVGGTAAGGTLQFLFSATTTIAVAIGQTWTGHVGFARLAGTFPVTPAIAFQERTAAGGLLTQVTEALGMGFTPTRGVITRTIAGATAERATLALRFPSIPAGAVNFSFLLFPPQMEQKPYATSPIYPATDTTGATTRGAENITIPAQDSWRSTQAATLFADVTVHPGSSANNRRGVFNLGGTGTNPRNNLYFTNAGVLANQHSNAAGTPSVPSANLLTLNAARPNIRMAMAISNEVARYAAWDGVTLSEEVRTPTLSLDLASTTQLNIAHDPVGAPRQLNGYVNRIAYLPRLLSVAEVRALVRGF